MDPRHRLTDLGPCQQLLTSVSLSHAAWDVQILCRSLVAHVPAADTPRPRPYRPDWSPCLPAPVLSQVICACACVTMGFNFDI